MELRDYKDTVVLHVDGDKCYDINGTWVYVRKGDYICNAAGNWVYVIRGDRVYDTQGNWIYKIHQASRYVMPVNNPDIGLQNGPHATQPPPHALRTHSEARSHLYAGEPSHLYTTPSLGYSSHDRSVKSHLSKQKFAIICGGIAVIAIVAVLIIGLGSRNRNVAGHMDVSFDTGIEAIIGTWAADAVGPAAQWPKHITFNNDGTGAIFEVCANTSTIRNESAIEWFELEGNHIHIEFIDSPTIHPDFMLWPGGPDRPWYVMIRINPCPIVEGRELLFLRQLSDWFEPRFFRVN